MAIKRLLAEVHEYVTSQYKRKYHRRIEPDRGDRHRITADRKDLSSQ